MNSEENNRLIQMIEETFVAIPKPECTKRVARSYDDEWFPSDERVAGHRALDNEDDWRQLGPDDIREFSDVLFWISPEGFRFYYPAFLRHAIVHWKPPHDRVHLECMEVIGRQPSIIDALTVQEAKVLSVILTELFLDEAGSHYYAEQSIIALELHAERAEQSTPLVRLPRDGKQM